MGRQREKTLQETIHSIRKNGGPMPSAQWLADRYGIDVSLVEDIIIDDNVQVAPVAAISTVQTAQKPQRRERVIRDCAPTVQNSEAANGEATAHDAPTKTKRSLRESVQALLLALLPFIFAGVSVAGSIRSYELCYGYLVRFNTESAAILGSIMLVGMAFAVPQAVPILWESARKGNRIAMFCIAIIISMATVATNVFITANELAARKVDSSAGSAKRASLEKEMADLDRRIGGLQETLAIDREERRILLAASKGLEVGTADYNRTRNNIADVKTRIDGQEREIAELEARKDATRNVMSSLPVDDSGYGIEHDIIRWGMAGLIEVGAPLALSLALFL